MAERRPVTAGEKLNYTGLFSAKELWKLIDGWFKDNGYGDRVEIYHNEMVAKDHKDIEIKYDPYTKVSDYVKLEHLIFIKIFGLVKKNVEKDGHVLKLDHGTIDITFNTFINTDYEGRWENKPEYFFLRTLIDKFVFKTYTGKYEAMLAQQVDQLKFEIESFLNMYKYK
jgi:hypothetical protein